MNFPFIKADSYNVNRDLFVAICVIRKLLKTCDVFVD